MLCTHCFTELPEPTPHEAFSAKAQTCRHCKTQNAIGIEQREHLMLGLFLRVESMDAELSVLRALSDPPKIGAIGAPMPAGPMTLKRKTR